jgi:adenine-specific DNA-methyltransferase
MKDKIKKTGSYYTPKIIADFLVDYLSVKLNDKHNISILEPSAGDGAFIDSLYQHKSLSQKIKRVTAIEKDKSELDKIKIKNPSFNGLSTDFLCFQENNSETYDLVIGNPPYIKRSLLAQYQIDYCKTIHREANLSDIKPHNIWTSFLVRCIKFTADNGIIAFVLPSELLQIKFAAEIRQLILQQFEKVEIFTFNELLFKDSKGQDTVLFIGEKQSNIKGVFYCNIDKIGDLEKYKFSLSQNIRIKESKWTHHHLETNEIELLEKLKLELNTVNQYCSSKPGVVTGANDYFIVNSVTLDKYSLHDYVRPIISKGIFLNGNIELTKEDFQILIDNFRPTYLIALNKNSSVLKDSKISEYLILGEHRLIHKRYKTSIRDKWYQIPNIGIPPNGFFFRRYDEYPKIIINSANVLSTDSAYAITMKNNYQIESFVFSFYNSLTLSFAELNGRYYGGGVLELTPNEFKGLPLPYISVNNKLFHEFSNEFKLKGSIKDICKKNDRLIIKSIDRNIDDESIEKLFRIREKLVLRRKKTE